MMYTKYKISIFIFIVNKKKNSNNLLVFVPFYSELFNILILKKLFTNNVNWKYHLGLIKK